MSQPPLLLLRNNRLLVRWFGFILFSTVLAGVAWKELYLNQLLPIDSMTLRLSFPLWSLFQSHLQNSSELLWNPLRNMGEPLLADPQTMITYPVRWLLSPLDDFLGFMQCWVMLHTLLAIGFMSLLAYRWYGDWVAAWGAGLLYGLNGFFTSRATVPNYFASAALIPAVLYFLDRKHVIGLAAALALQWVAGSPPFSFLTAWVLLAVVAVDRSRWGCLWRGGLLSLCLAAVQWIPFLEMLQQSMRPMGLSDPTALAFSIPPGQFLKQLLVPQWIALRPTVLGDLSEVCFYFGPVALLLAALSIRGGRKEKLLVVGTAAGLLLSLGAYLPGYKYAFFFQVARFPARWILPASVAISLLVAAGLVRMKDQKWKLAALGLLAFDLLLFAQHTRIAWFPLSYLDRPPAMAVDLMKDPRFPRLYHSPELETAWIRQKFVTAEDYLLARDMLVHSYGTAFGVAEGRSCQVLRSKRIDAFQQRLRQSGPESPLWSQAGISTILRPLPGSPTVDRDHIEIWTHKNPLPLLYFEPESTPGKVAPRHYSAGHVQADVELERPARLIFREVLYPGWEGNVNGQRARLSLFENTFIALNLSAGKHAIELRYSPISFQWGFMISLGTLLLLIARTCRRSAR